MKPSRHLVVDWLRGAAVVLMILAHSQDAWLAPALRRGTGYAWVSFLSGIPSRLFLLLVGVSVAIRVERQISQRGDARMLRRQLFIRGLLVLVLAYVFRLQECILAGGHWERLARVDILNCIGACLLVLATVVVPSGSRPRIAAALGAAAVFFGLGPVVGTAVFPDWVPRALSSYIGGPRPWAWFPLFPWAGWSLLGVAVGHAWVRGTATPAGATRTFLLTGILGAIMGGTVFLVRDLFPDLIVYRTLETQQMGPGAFSLRLGFIGVLALLGWAATRAWGARFSPLRQMGRTSLLIYWVHVDLCYGVLTKPWRRSSSWALTMGGFVFLTLLMLGLSMAKTRFAPKLLALFRRSGAVAPG